MFYNEYINYLYEAPFLGRFVKLVPESDTNVFRSTNPVLQTLYYSDLVERLNIDDYSKGTISVIQSQLNLLNLQSCLPMSDDYTVNFESQLVSTFSKLCSQQYNEGITIPLVHGRYVYTDQGQVDVVGGEQKAASELFSRIADYFCSSVGLITPESPDREMLRFIIHTGLSYAYYNYNCYSRLISLLEGYTDSDCSTIGLDSSYINLFLDVFTSARYQDNFMFNAEEYVADLRDDVESQLSLSSKLSNQQLLELKYDRSCKKFVPYQLLKLITEHIPVREQAKYISVLNVFEGIDDDELRALVNKGAHDHMPALLRCSQIY